MFTKKWLDDKRIILFTLVVFLIWQIALGAVIFLGKNFFPTTGSYLYTEKEVIVNPPIFWSRANFDGIHYLDIARKDYGIYQQAFFPVYPKLIKLISPFLMGRDLLAGLVISWVAFFVAIFLFYKLVRLDFEEKIAKRTILYLLVFPTAFFFSAVYTESLLLILVLGSFYFARIKKWWLAGILGALSSGTRLVGIFLLPALLVEWVQQDEFKNQISKIKIAIQNLKRKNIFGFYNLIFHFSFFIFYLFPILLISSGLLFYMRYLAINYHDPLMFLHVQPAFGAERVADKFILLYQVFWRYLKMVATTKADPLYFTVWLEFLTAFGFLGLLVFSYLKKIRLSYLIFAVLAYITPTLTGTFSSMPRYVLVLFPCFIAMALAKNKIVQILLFTFYFLLLIISTIFFTRGYWIG
ncbi:MAG: hypothetical protein ACOZBZ_01975 [Patescibacteria group bacterium]